MSYLNKAQGVNITVGVPTDKRMKIAYRERITTETVPNSSTFLYDTSTLARWEFMTVDVTDARTKAEREASAAVYSGTFKLVGGLANGNWIQTHKNGYVIAYEKQLQNFSAYYGVAHAIFSGAATQIIAVPAGNFVHGVMIYGDAIEEVINTSVNGFVKVSDLAERYVIQSSNFNTLAAVTPKLIDTTNGYASPVASIYLPIMAAFDTELRVQITGDLTGITENCVVKILYQV